MEQNKLGAQQAVNKSASEKKIFLKPHSKSPPKVQFFREKWIESISKNLKYHLYY